MDIAGARTLLETAHDAATAVGIESVMLGKQHPNNACSSYTCQPPPTQFPSECLATIRVPGNHPSAGVPPGGSLSLGWATVTRAGCCHSDGLLQHLLEPII